MADTSPMLATWDPASVGTFLETASGPGTIEIEGRCVALVVNEKRIRPVWPLPARWDVSARSIDVTDVRGSHLEIKDGDRLELAGVTRVPEFVSEPDPSCAADETFVVTSVEMLARVL